MGAECRDSLFEGRFVQGECDWMIGEERVVNESGTVYGLDYTYDGPGNRLSKIDYAPTPDERTLYFYDTDPNNRDPNYPTNNNRLMRGAGSVGNGAERWIDGITR